MKFQSLPSTIENGVVTGKQHLSCFLIDDTVAIDAGNLAFATNLEQKSKIRDVVLTHAHIDHIAGLPLFVDDLFASLTRPVDVYAAAEVIQTLKSDIFNWSVYPDFAELENDNGPVLRYCEFETGRKFQVAHLSVEAIGVNHKVPSVGFSIADDKSCIAISGDTAEMDGFWKSINSQTQLDALLIECAFPNRLEELANVSHHLTPRKLKGELEKLEHANCPVYVINIKPSYYDEVVKEIGDLEHVNLSVLEVGKQYEW